MKSAFGDGFLLAEPLRMTEQINRDEFLIGKSWAGIVAQAFKASRSMRTVKPADKHIELNSRRKEILPINSPVRHSDS